jgi:SAM-dependent methyltransferase
MNMEKEDPAMSNENWRAYGDLAWTDTIVSGHEEAAEESEFFVKVLKENSRIPIKTLLHLGCGAGFNDRTFKKYFTVTGADVSEGMLEIARGLNPEVRYLRGDMRTVELGELFDAVVIPDAIGYMTTPADLRAAVGAACRHLASGGVLLLTPLVAEDFRENNFAYVGSKNGVHVTIFENNCVLDPASGTYTATLVYLIRREGRIEIVTDRHTLGLFPLAVWRSLIDGAGLDIRETSMDHNYDPYLLGEGEYRLRVFAGVKKG